MTRYPGTCVLGYAVIFNFDEATVGAKVSQKPIIIIAPKTWRLSPRRRLSVTDVKSCASQSLVIVGPIENDWTHHHPALIANCKPVFYVA